ncbi:aspartate aminotransferase, mitochondrial-like isoform X1 [Cylas formicarius]|uniref:aspartate aminotransferase, mitochondrial-like isoform X1 n=1 Tax=Cylas formicarius TaxID=197179 RepID=UPI002958AB7F|nr:aspartate aminotransferase, mitochondrial-like isoform X1 [Cylas formicarius]
MYIKKITQILRKLEIITYASVRRTSDWWQNVSLGPPDPILGLTEAYNLNKHPKKMNIGVGGYKDDEGKPYVLPCVREAEAIIAGKKMDKDYAPIQGIAEFNEQSAKLAFGGESYVIRNSLNVTVQAVSGTGALRLGGAFLKNFFPGSKIIYLPSLTWLNHVPVFKHSGLDIKTYKYYDPETRTLDFCGLMEDIGNMPENSVILFHPIAHNPTGVDPTREQWVEISHAVKRKRLLVFFDMAYQGFVTGDLDADAASVRLFIDECHHILLAQTYSKVMGLYGERIGAFTVITGSEEEAGRVLSQLKILIRAMYANPPLHGARIATEILKSEKLTKQWTDELKGMAQRIISIRQKLKQGLEREGSTRNWDHVISQRGMFCFTGLNPEQVKKLTEDFHIYLNTNGRISIAAVGSNNVDYLAHAIHQVTK